MHPTLLSQSTTLNVASLCPGHWEDAQLFCLFFYFHFKKNLMIFRNNLSIITYNLMMVDIMTVVFKKIDKDFMELLSKRMHEKGVNQLDFTFDEFIDLIDYEGTAKTIRTINQRATIIMNEVGPANWYFNIGSRDNGRIVHISREKKEPYNLP